MSLDTLISLVSLNTLEALISLNPLEALFAFKVDDDGVFFVGRENSA